MDRFKFYIVILTTLMLITSGLGGTSPAGDDVINGAGASFPYPVYSQWAYKYHKLTGTKINYQSIGSGGGIAQIKAKTVDFGASDAPLKMEELDKAGLIQFPMVMGGVVPVVNIKGIQGGTLNLTAELLADIFMGKIKKWNDPKIQAVNPKTALPNSPTYVIHRSDGSGTTWIFTNYLSKISSDWKNKVGSGKAVSWPTGYGGKGNEGVAAYVQKTNGAIGYVEFAYALQNKMTSVTLKNRYGNFVPPTIDTFQSAAANADWANAPGFYMVLTDQPGKDSWPITGATFILMHKEQADLNKAKTILDFLSWCYRHGGRMAEALHYVPMPKEVMNLVQSIWKKELSSKGQSIWE